MRSADDMAPQVAQVPQVLQADSERDQLAVDHDRESLASLVEARRRIYDLRARIRELEATLRRREYADAIRDVEERALALDLEVKAGYLRHLETAVGELNNHSVAVTRDRDAVVGHLRQVEAQLQGLQGQRSYRAYVRMMGILQSTGPLYTAMRFCFRAAIKVVRALRRIVRGRAGSPAS